MPNLSQLSLASQTSTLLSRMNAALERIASDGFAAATDPNDVNLAWVKRAWLRYGQPSMIPWYAQRGLEHAVHQSQKLRDAIDAGNIDAGITDADVSAFALAYVLRCVQLGI